jgi:hypothetical protein
MSGWYMAILIQSLEDYKIFEQKMNPEWALLVSLDLLLSFRFFLGLWNMQLSPECTPCHPYSVRELVRGAAKG